MHGQRLVGAWLIIGMALSLGACGSDHGSVNGLSASTTAHSVRPNEPIAASASGFTLAVSPDCFLAAGSTAKFMIATLSQPSFAADASESADSDIDADVLVTISARDAVDLRALYCELRYDPARYTPVGVEHLPWAAGGETIAGDAPVSGPTQESHDMLTLEVLSEPGVVHLGQVLANWDERGGLTGNGELARVIFTNRPFEQARKTSVALPVATERPLLTVIMQPAWLDWRWHQIGDYNQDGLVTASDLTPVGAHFGEAGDVHSGYVTNPDNTQVETFDFEGGDVRQLIDTSDNGVIDIYDITAIGVNFGRGADSFAVYHAASPAAYSAEGTAAVEPLAVFPLSQVRRGDAAAEPVVFDTVLPGLVDGDYYWIQPLNGDTPGPASEFARVDLSLIDDFSARLGEECFLDGGSVDSVRLEVGVSGERVAVDAIISGYEQLRLLSIALDYDAQSYRADNAWGSSHKRANAPVMPLMSGGQQFYLCRNPWEARLVAVNKFQDVIVDGEWRIARAFLLQEPTVTSGGSPSGSWLFGEPVIYYDPSTQIMSWEYALPGDGNQDSIVMIDDLLPILRFLDRAVAEAGRAAELADYNHDGFVGFSDITVIGQYFGMRVEGYEIYMGTYDAFEYQDSAQLLGAVSVVDDAIGDRFNERLRFEFHIDAPVSGQYLWIAPYSGSETAGYSGFPAGIP